MSQNWHTVFTCWCINALLDEKNLASGLKEVTSGKKLVVNKGLFYYRLFYLDAHTIPRSLRVGMSTVGEK